MRITWMTQTPDVPEESRVPCNAGVHVKAIQIFSLGYGKHVENGSNRNPHRIIGQKAAGADSINNELMKL